MNKQIQLEKLKELLKDCTEEQWDKIIKTVERFNYPETNDEQPFEVGERIVWDDMVGTVMSNEVDHGKVLVDGYEETNIWCWEFDGIKCKRIK